MSIRLLRLPFKHITNTSTLARPSIIKRTMASSNNNTNTNEPSMIGGHAQYAKGYVEETIGNVTGNKEWTESGKKDSKEGIESMKAASANKSSEPAASGIGGKIEKAAGSAVGCEGMEKEGAERMNKAQ